MGKKSETTLFERVIQLIAALLAIVGGLLSPAQAFVPWPWLSSHLPAIIPTLEAAVICIFLILAIIAKLNDGLKIDPSSTDLVIALRAVNQFRNAWVSLWAWWAVFWTLLAASRWVLLSGGAPSAALQSYVSIFFAVSCDGANLLNSLGLIVCFLVMFVITVDKNAESHHSTYSMTWTAGCAFVAVFVIGEACVLLLTPHNEGQYSTDTPQIFKWVTSLSGGTALALLVGRLESKHLRTPTWVLVSLYIYAVMQPAYNYFDEKSEYMDVFATAFLVAKFIMFFRVNLLLKSGDLLYYMTKLRPIVEHGKSERDAFMDRLREPEDVSDSSG